MELGLSNDKNFEIKLFDDLRNKKEYHTNEVISALRIAIELKKKSINNAFLASMQSGKTRTIKFLCNYILPKINLLNEEDSILFLTSMRDTDLKEQNIRALEGYESNIFVMPMHKFRSTGLAEIKKYNVKLIIRDEDQYGCGKESTFDLGFFSGVRDLVTDMPLLSVSATPFDIIDAKNKGLKVNITYGLRHQNYFGISEMLENNMIRNLPMDYEHFKVQDDKSIISKPIQKSILHLNKFESGIGIIRCCDTQQAVKLKEQFKSLDQKGYETIIIGCKKNITDYSIKEGLSILSRKMRVEKKRIILLVIHALSAGKDLKKLKEKVRFVIETRKTQLANCVQGLPGRICGYHENRDILIYANKKILKHYSSFEKNPETFNDEEWIDELFFDTKVKTLSTQTRLLASNQEGYFTPIDSTIEIPIEELFTNQGERILNFLNKWELNQLMRYFEEACYEEKLKIGGLKNQSVQLRVASNYSKKYNTVYKGWNKGKGDNFRSLFSHKNRTAKYGLLISNFPKIDVRNKIHFCGIKVFYPGKEIYLNRSSKTTNISMYSM